MHISSSWSWPGLRREHRSPSPLGLWDVSGRTEHTTIGGEAHLGEDGRGVYLLAVFLIRVCPWDMNFLALPCSVTQSSHIPQSSASSGSTMVGGIRGLMGRVHWALSARVLVAASMAGARWCRSWPSPEGWPGRLGWWER